jgi:hypothetical protein
MVLEKQRWMKLLLVTALLLISTAFVEASSLEEAKIMVDDYYSYTMQKDVDAYVALFDEAYLVGLYGSDYEDFFNEVFSYVEIEDYEIDFSYYTESEESLTLFFNLKSSTILDGVPVDMDNDLVALFAKNPGGLKLHYIILQETFIEQMNREVIYESAIKIMTEEQSDLKAEAERKGIELVDYKSLFEDKMRGDRSKWYIWLLVLLAIILMIYFSKSGKLKGFAKVTNKDSLRSYQAKAKEHLVSAKKSLKENYDKAAPIVKKRVNDVAEKSKELAGKAKDSLQEGRKKVTKKKQAKK